MKIKITLLALIFISMNMLATNYYWVGGSGNWSDYINHWATTSGGAIFHNQVPQSTDNVYFDANSFSSAGQTVTIDQTVIQCADMDWTGVVNTPTLYGDYTTSSKIYGSLTLVSGMAFNFAGQISMEATTTGKTITTAGIPLNTSITFNGIGGEYTLQDSLTVLYQVYLNNGTLNTNNQTINIASFISITSSPRILNLGSSIINLSNHWYVIWNVNPTGMTLNAGSSKMYASNANGDTYFTGGGFTYNDLSFTGSLSNGVFLDANTMHDVSFANGGNIYAGGTFHDVSIGGNAVLKSGTFHNVTIAKDGDLQSDNTFNNLTLSPGHTYTLQSNQTQTILNSLIVNGNCGALINILKSSYPGSQANISSPSGSINVSFVTIKDLNATGGASFTANNAIDLGNNTGWTINTLPSKNLYWVGNSGNWDDGNHWAITSGGSPSGCSPTPVDNVFFDANSFSQSGQTVTINSPTAYLNDMKWTGVTNNPTIIGINTLKIYGSLTLASVMTFGFSGTLSFEATTMGHTITTAGISINTALTFNGIGGGWTLQDELNTPFLIYLNSGSLNTNNQTVNASGLWSDLISVRSMTTGTSIFNMSGGTVWTVNPQGMTMDAVNSTINGTAFGTNGQYFKGAQFTYKNLSFTGGTYGMISGDFGGSTFNDVSFAGDAIIYGGIYHNVTMSKQGEINGNNTFNDLTLSAGYTYTLQSNQTQTILHSLTVNGNCGALINILKSSYPGSQANISSPSGSINVSFVTLKDINASGGAAFIADNAIDLGNNTGWTINTLPTKNLYWIGNSGNWDDGSHWATSSGGSPSGCSPTPVDNVFFDANSFSLAGQSVTANIPTAYFNNMDWTGVTNNPTLAGTNTLQVYGSLTLASAMTFGFSGTLSFEATTMGHTITTAGTPINTSLTFNGIGGGWTLLDELTSPYIVYFNNGSLNTNSQTVNVLGFWSNATTTRAITTGTSTINISGQAMWYFNPQGMTLNAAGSIIKGISAGGSQDFYSNGFTYNDVLFTGGTVGTLYEYYTRSTFHDVSFVYHGVINGGSFHDVTFGDHASISGANTFNNVTMAKNGDINGSNTFNNLSFTPGYTYTLQGGQTQTVHNICAQGTGSLPIRIQSNNAGTAAIISKASGTMCWNYVRISDIIGTGGAIFNAGLAPTISEDMGGNTGVLFTGGCVFANCTPCITPSITAQPNNNTVCAGSNAVFATTATGTGLTYQWQLNPGTGFTNLSNSAPYNGVTTNALNISTVTPILNGYQYRCIVTDSCSNIITTSTSTITIVAPPIATSSVSSTSVTVSATGGTPPYTGTGTFTGLAAGTYTYTVTDANGCIGTTTATIIATPGSSCSNAIPFTPALSYLNNNNLSVSEKEMWFSFVADSVNENIQLIKNPTSLGHIHTMAFYSGTCSSLNVVDSVNVTPTNDSLLTLNESNLTAGNIYYIKASREVTTCPGCVNDIAEFTVCHHGHAPACIPPSIIQQPSNSNVCYGGNTIFTIGATGTGLTYQWQVSIYGGPYNSLVDGVIYNGVLTPNLSITTGTNIMDGYQYQCIVSGTCSPISISNPGMLNMTFPPSMVAYLNPTIFACDGYNPYQILSVSFDAGTTYQWQIDQTGGGVFTNIPIIPPYSLSNSNSVLMITPPTLGMNGYKYQCVISANSCGPSVTTNTSTLVVYQQPTVAVNSQTICAGQSATLTGSGTGASSYSWSTGDNTNSISVTPLTTSTYTVTGSETHGCPSSPASATVTVISPTATIYIGGNSSETVCQNTASPDITFTGSGGTAPYTFTYTINGGANQTISTSGGSNSVTLPVTTVTVGTYTYSLVSVQESSSTACSQAQSGSVIITVLISPTINLNSSTICFGQNATLCTITNGTFTAYWATPQNGNPGYYGYTNTVSPITTTNYEIEAVNNNNSCISQTYTDIVTVNQLPTMTSPATATICSGGTVNISLASDIGSSYTWIATDNLNTTGESTTIQTGNLLSDAIINNSTSDQIVVYTVTPTSNPPAGCLGTPQTISVTVHPIITMTSTVAATICSGTALNISLTSNVASTYTWIAADNVNTTGESTTLQSTGTLNDIITNNSTVAQTVTYTVTPTSTTANCLGTPQTITVIVNPKPTMTSAAVATICSGGTVTIALASNVNSTYTWIATDNLNTTGESTTLQASGTLNDIITNNTTSNQTVTYTVTPTSNPPAGCVGSPQTVIVTVHPAPTMTNANSAIICNGGTVSIPLTSNFASNYKWIATNNLNTTGESTTLQTGSPLHNTITNNSTSDQTITYTVTPTSNPPAGCVGTPQTLTVTVHPTPTMTSSATATICSGGTVSIPLTSNVGSTYKWIASNNPNTTGESLTNQTTSTLSNTIINNTSTVQTVTYTVTPTSTGTAVCSGTSQIVTVTVNPKPAMTSAAVATICSGTALNVSLASNVASTYKWIATNNVNTTGESTTLQTSGTLNDVVTNNTTSNQTVTYTVTPTSNPPAGCVGSPQTVIVTVHPAPTMTSANSAIICNGGTVSIPLTSNFASTYKWIATNNLNTTGESTTLQTGSPLHNTITNNSTSDQTVTYIVTPTSNPPVGCAGTPQTITVTVHPTITMTSANSATICSGGTVSIPLTSNVGSAYKWSASNNPNTTGESLTNQTTNPLSNTIVNNSSVAQMVTYTVTPKSTTGGCLGIPQTITVTVNPRPVAIATPSAQTICSGATTSITLSSTTPGTTFSWNVTQHYVTGATSGTGSTIAQTIYSSGNITDNAVYQITPSANGCVGITIYVVVMVKPAGCDGGLAIDYYVPCMGITTNLGTTTSSVFSGQSTVTGKNISVMGTLYVDAPITFNACNFAMSPGASIVMNANLTISNNTHIFSCGAMWDGIHVNNSSRILTIRNDAFIEDAINAVVSTNGGQYNIRQAIFNRNLTAVAVTGSSNPGVFLNSIVTSRTIPPTPFPTVANLTGGTPLTGFSPTNLKAPNNHIKGLYGINATDVSNFYVGNASPFSTNTFDAIMCGINLTRTSATIYNNNFQFLLISNIGLPCLGCPVPPTEAGYGIKATGSSSTAYSITIGGNTNPQPNTFLNTYSAIYVKNYNAVSIVNNTINNSTTYTPSIMYTTNLGYGAGGISVTPTGWANSIDVVGNTINNCDAGIWVNRLAIGGGIYSKWVFIDHNSVKADQYGHCTNGIAIQDVANYQSFTSTDMLKIQYNTIEQANNCITATNVNLGLAIRANPSLIVRSNLGVTTGNGIRLQNCNSAKVHDNYSITLSNPASPINSTSTNFRGISVTTSPFSRITCNKIVSMGESMTFNGSCLSSYIQENTMNGGNRGLVLRSNGEIGQQGTPLITANPSCDFWWSQPATTFTAQTYTDNTTNANSNSQLWVNDTHAPAGYTGIPISNSGLASNVLTYYHQAPPSPAGLNLSNGGEPFLCSSIHIYTWQGHAPHLASILDTAQLTTLAFDTAQYPVYEQENRYQHKIYAFNTMDASSDSIPGPALQHFYDSTQIAALGQLKAVDKALALQDYALAGATNSGVYTVNLMQTNQQQFNTLYLLSLNDTTYNYTQAELDAIYSIAKQCPLAGGNAVWQARALYCAIENSLIEFADNCISDSKRMIALNNKEASSNFILYPNPNDGTMSLAYTLNNNETGIFELYDITGKHIVNYALDGSSSMLNINNIQLNAGLYYYNIRVNERIVKTEKIVIIK